MAHTGPRISVLMPVYNTARYVDEACRSILGQTFRDFELVVVDDGSNDGSTDRLRALAATDARIRLIARENRGLIATRNELLSLARGELVAWMDSDDRAMPERLALQAKRFDDDPELVCLGSAVLEVDPEGEPIRTDAFPTSHEAIAKGMQAGGAMRFPATMMRREAALRVGGFREPFKMGEDFDLFLRLMEVGKLENLATVLLHYRQHPSNTSRLHGTSWPLYRDTILDLARERRERGSDRLQRGEPLGVVFPPALKVGSLVWESHSYWSRLALADGRAATARKHAARALRVGPLRLASWKLAARVLVDSARLS